MDWLETLSPLSSTTADGAAAKLSFPWAAAHARDAPDLRKAMDLSAEFESFNAAGRYGDVALSDQSSSGLGSALYQRPWTLGSAKSNSPLRLGGLRSPLPSPDAGLVLDQNANVLLSGSGDLDKRAQPGEGPAKPVTSAHTQLSPSSPQSAADSQGPMFTPAWSLLMTGIEGQLTPAGRLASPGASESPAVQNSHSLGSPDATSIISTAEPAPTLPTQARNVRLVDYTPSPLPFSTPLPRVRSDAGAAWGPWQTASGLQGEQGVSQGPRPGLGAKRSLVTAEEDGEQPHGQGQQQTQGQGQDYGILFAAASRRSTRDTHRFQPEPSWASTEAEHEADLRTTPGQTSAQAQAAQASPSSSAQESVGAENHEGGGDSVGGGTEQSSRSAPQSPAATGSLEFGGQAADGALSASSSVNATPQLLARVHAPPTRMQVDPGWAALWASTASSLFSASPGPALALGIQQQASQYLPEEEGFAPAGDGSRDGGAAADSWRSFMLRSASTGVAATDSPGTLEHGRGGTGKTPLNEGPKPAAGTMFLGSIQEYLTPAGPAVQLRSSPATAAQQSSQGLPPQSEGEETAVHTAPATTAAAGNPVAPAMAAACDNTVIPAQAVATDSAAVSAMATDSPAVSAVAVASDSHMEPAMAAASDSPARGSTVQHIVLQPLSLLCASLESQRIFDPQLLTAGSQPKGTLSVSALALADREQQQGSAGSKGRASSEDTHRRRGRAQLRTATSTSQQLSPLSDPAAHPAANAEAEASTSAASAEAETAMPAASAEAEASTPAASAEAEAATPAASSLGQDVPCVELSPAPWATPLGDNLLLGSPLMQAVSEVYQAPETFAQHLGQQAPEQQIPYLGSPSSTLVAALLPGGLHEYQTPAASRPQPLTALDEAGMPSANGSSAGSTSKAALRQLTLPALVQQDGSDACLQGLRHMAASAAGSHAGSVASTESADEAGQDSEAGDEREDAASAGSGVRVSAVQRPSSLRRSRGQTAAIARALARVKQLSREVREREEQVARLVSQLNVSEEERVSLAAALMEARGQAEVQAAADRASLVRLHLQLQHAEEQAREAEAEADEQQQRAVDAERLLRELRQQVLQQEERLQDLQAQLQRQQAPEHSVQLLELRLLMQQLGDLASDVSHSLGLPYTQEARPGAQSAPSSAQELGPSMLGPLVSASPSRGVGTTLLKPNTPARMAASGQGQAQWYEQVWAGDTLSQLIDQAQAVAAQLQACMPTLSRHALGTSDPRAAAELDTGVGAGQSGCEAEVQDLAQQLTDGVERGRAEQVEEEGREAMQQAMGSLKGQCAQLGAVLAEQLACAQQVQLHLQVSLQDATQQQQQQQGAVVTEHANQMPTGLQGPLVEAEAAADVSGGSGYGAVQGLAVLDALQQGVKRLRVRLHVEEGLSRQRGLELGHAQAELRDAQELLEQLGHSNAQALDKIQALRDEREALRQKAESLLQQQHVAREGRAELEQRLSVAQELAVQEQVLRQALEQRCAQLQCDLQAAGSGSTVVDHGRQWLQDERAADQGEQQTSEAPQALAVNGAQAPCAQPSLAGAEPMRQVREQDSVSEQVPGELSLVAGQDTHMVVAQLQDEAELWQQQLGLAEEEVSVLRQQLEASHAALHQEQIRAAGLIGRVQQLQLQLVEAEAGEAAKDEALLAQVVKGEALSRELAEAGARNGELLRQVDGLEERLGRAEVQAVQLQQRVEELREEAEAWKAECERQRAEVQAAVAESEGFAAEAAEARERLGQARAKLAGVEAEAAQRMQDSHAAVVEEVQQLQAQLADALQTQGQLQEAASRQLNVQQEERAAQVAAVATAVAQLLQPKQAEASVGGPEAASSEERTEDAGQQAGSVAVATVSGGAGAGVAIGAEPLAWAEAEVGRLLAHVQVLQQEGAAMRAQLHGLEDEVAALRQEAGSAREEAQAQRRSAVEAAEVARLTAASLSRLQAAFEALGEERRRLAEEVEQAEELLQAAESACQEARLEQQAAEKSLNNARAAAQAAENAAAAAVEEVAAAKLEAKQALATQAEALAQAQAVVQSQAQALRTQAEALVQARALGQAQAQALEAQAETVAQARLQMHEEAAGQAAEAAARAQEAEQGRLAARAQGEREVARLCAELETARAALSRAEQEVSEQAARAGEEREVRDLHEAGVQARWEARLSALREEHRAAQRRAVAAEEEVAVARAAAEEAEQRAEEEAEAHAALTAALTARIEAYELRLAGAGRHGVGLVDGLAAEVSRLQADLDEAESRLEAVQGQSHSSSAERPGTSALAEACERYQEEVQELHQQLARAQLRIATLEVETGKHQHERDWEEEEEEEPDVSCQGRPDQREGAGTHISGARDGADAVRNGQVCEEGRQEQLEELWQRLHGMLVEDVHRAAARRQRQQRREQRQQQQQPAGPHGQGTDQGQYLVLVPSSQLSSCPDSSGAQEQDTPGAAVVQDLTALQQAWEQGDRLLLLREAVHCMHALRQQNRCMARLLRRVERDGPTLGRLEMLHQENKDLLCKYIATQAAQRQYERVVRRLSEENSELTTLVIQAQGSTHMPMAL